MSIRYNHDPNSHVKFEDRVGVPLLIQGIHMPSQFRNVALDANSQIYSYILFQSILKRRCGIPGTAAFIPTLADSFKQVIPHRFVRYFVGVKDAVYQHQCLRQGYELTISRVFKLNFIGLAV